MRHDARGIPVSSGSERALARYETALAQLQTYVGDPVATIASVRDVDHRFGGSHAQRDVLSLTLIDAARRRGRVSLAKHVLAERLVARPGGAWGRRLLARIEAAPAVPH